MNRLDFLKKLGLGAIGVAVAPMLILQKSDEGVIRQEIRKSIIETPPTKVRLMGKTWRVEGVNGQTNKIIASGYYDFDANIIYWDDNTIS